MSMIEEVTNYIRRLMHSCPTHPEVVKVACELNAIIGEAVPPKPYGYVWFNKNMEQRFTPRPPHPQSTEQPIGEVKPVYDVPVPEALPNYERCFDAAFKALQLLNSTRPTWNGPIHRAAALLLEATGPQPEATPSPQRPA